ncbi:succinylglutamate desuccinylase/aspartoacylase family protein [Candidatus Pacearchaeota archaeon]|nr:succinylglutamate desuccinylase/aspartoacylase family protein [Candidatus Pacearchaeota archaeon]
MENIRVIIKKGKSAGKNIVILAGVHGNEVCGVKAFNEIIPNIEIEKGEVTFIYANLKAQKQNKRFVEENLNRCFLDNQPEEMANTLEGKTAKAIMLYLQKADILLDLHSANSSSNLKFLICESDCLELAQTLSPQKIIMGIDNAEKGGTDGYMFNMKKPGICVECGAHETKESIEVAKESIYSLLRKIQAIKGEPKIYPDKNLYRAKYMYKTKNGPFKIVGKYKNFDKVKEKTLIGTDGKEEIYIEKGDVVMFPNEREEIGKECFLILRAKNIY